MTSIKIPAYITPSSTYNGAFEVIAYTNTTVLAGVCSRISRRTIPCHNLATAQTIKRSINNGTYGNEVVSIPRSVERSLLTPEQLGGCLTGGCGYDPAVTWIATGRVERVSNWATARNLKRNYPAQSEQVFASVLA